MEHLQQLRKAIETAVGYSLRSPKNFDTLAEQIFERQHQHVSPTTLKRLWGYVASNSLPRQSTLDLLAQFLGYADYNAFCEQLEPVANSEAPSTPQNTSTTNPHKHRKLVVPLVVASLIITAGTVVYFFTHRQSSPETPSPYVLQAGQTFGSHQEYLALFGIHANDTLWGQRLPHHPYISIWGPQYHHWKWHNDGDSALLMPTITEHWEPDDGSADCILVATRNSDHYLAQRDLNELRITFVRGLTPDGDSLTFTGVYRMDMNLSDYRHVTWTRVADRIDLEHLDYLEELRN